MRLRTAGGSVVTLLDFGTGSLGVGRSFPVWTAQFPESLSRPGHANFDNVGAGTTQAPTRPTSPRETENLNIHRGARLP